MNFKSTILNQEFWKKRISILSIKKRVFSFILQNLETCLNYEF